MLRKTTLILVLVGGLGMLQAQKKKDLIAEVAQLKDSISGLNDSISKANRQINSSNANAALFEKENTELRDANATLLKNLSSFSQISKQNTETVNKALETLKQKEQQLKFITDDFSRNDSIAIVILTQAKETLGPEAQVGISDGNVLFSNKLDFLFGSDSGTQLTETAATFIDNIAQIIQLHPDRLVSVEGLNITGEFGVTFAQATAVANQLIGTKQLAPERVSVKVRDGNFKEGVLIRLTGDSKAFYKQLKDAFK